MKYVGLQQKSNGSGRQHFNKIPKTNTACNCAVGIYSYPQISRDDYFRTPALVSCSSTTRLTLLNLIFWVLRIRLITTAPTDPGQYPAESDRRPRKTCNTSPVIGVVRACLYVEKGSNVADVAGWAKRGRTQPQDTGSLTLGG